jgi:hypothetical protein
MRKRGAMLLGLLGLICPLASAQAADGGTDASVPDAADAGCRSVNTLGECQGQRLRVCVNGVPEETDCTATHGEGFTCRLVGALQAAQCVFEAEDAGNPVATDGGAAAVEGDGGAPEAEVQGGCWKPSPVDRGAAFVGVFGLRRWCRRGRRQEPGGTRGVT